MISFMLSTNLKQQENHLEEILEEVVNNPTEENKKDYLDNLNKFEYSILIEAEKYPPKSPEYFEFRKMAFACRGKYARMMLPKWVSKYGKTQGCPHKYEDTLNIPFRSISLPK